MSHNKDTVADAILRREFFLQRFASFLVNKEVDGTIQAFSRKLPSLLNEFGDAIDLTMGERRAVTKAVTVEMAALWTNMWSDITEQLGEMAIMDGSNRMANAVAMEDSVIISLPRAGLEAMLAKQEPLVKTLIRILVDNLRSVHEAYMIRPRSVQDYMNAISYHMGGFRKYLEIDKEADPAGEGMRRLILIEQQMDVLREQFIGHKDKRESVIKEADSIPIRKTRNSNGGNPNSGAKSEKED